MRRILVLCLAATLLVAAKGAVAGDPSTPAAACVEGRGRCIQCNLNKTRCGECLDGFSPNTQGLCTPCPANCLECSVSRQCERCALGFSLSESTGACVKCKDPHCTACNATRPSQCYNCQDTFAVDEDSGSCRPCAEKNCKTCYIAKINPDQPPENVCLTCKTGFLGIFLPDSISLSCTRQRCPFKNCAECRKAGDDFQCGRCMDGYWAASYKADCQKGRVPGCAQYVALDTCQACSPGYVLKDSRCIRVVAAPCSPQAKDWPGCLNQHDGPAQCTEGEGACLLCNSRRTRCGQCAAGFSPDASGKCAKCPANCAECSPTGKCLQCNDKYTLSPVNATCLACKGPLCLQCEANDPGFCYSCPPGYAVDWDKGTCVACQKNCAECFVRSSNVVHACIRCTGDFITDVEKLTGSKCNKPCPYPNCGFCSEDQCLSCNAGYVAMDKTTCVKGLLPGCAVYRPADLDTCTWCNKGLLLKDGGCISINTAQRQ